MDNLVETTSNLPLSSKRTDHTVEGINTEAEESVSPTRTRSSWPPLLWDMDDAMEDTAPTHIKLSPPCKDNLPDVKDNVRSYPRHPARVKTYGINPSFPGIPRTICPIPQCTFKSQTEFQRDLHYLRTHIWRLGSRYDKENERREMAYLKMGKNEDGSWFGAENYCEEPESELSADQISKDFDEWKEEYASAGFSRSDFVPAPRVALRWGDRQTATFLGHIRRVAGDKKGESGVLERKENV